MAKRGDNSNDVSEATASATAVLPPPKARARKAAKPAPLEMPLTDAARRAWFGPADAIFLLFAVGTLLRSRGAMLDDPGLGWHLRNIDAMIAEGGWLSRDPFTQPLADWPWRTNVWLGDLWLWLGWQWAGLEGIAVVTSIVIALICRVMFGLLTRDGVPWPAAAFWTFTGGMATSISWVARPNVFSFLFLMLVAWTCDRYHRGKCSARQTLWLWPLMALWANVHGGFPAGVVTIGIALIVEAALALGIPHGKDVAGAKRRTKHLALLFAGALAATCINPYGWEMYPWIFRLLGNDYFMNTNMEWQSPNFHALGAMRYELFILALPLVLALSKRKPSLTALVISLAWLHAALSGQRYIALWVLVTVPLVARMSVQIPWLRRRAAALDLTPQLREMFTGAPRPGYPLACVVICLVLLGWARVSNGFSYIAPAHIPTQALDKLVSQAEGKVVFHHYNWGGYITWRGWPKVLNWIDDRNEVHGQAHIEEYFSIIDARDAWRDKLDRYGVELVCIPPHKPLASRLAEDERWHETYRDDYAVIFKRRAK